MLSPNRHHFKKQCLSIECIHCKGPHHKRYGNIYFFGCVIVTIRSSSSFPPSLCLRGGQGSLSLPCVTLFVCLIVGKFLDCPWESLALWNGFSLGVLQAHGGWAPPLHWAHLSCQQPLVVAEFLCRVIIQLIFSEEGDPQAFLYTDEVTSDEMRLRYGSWCDTDFWEWGVCLL